jgi:hypothetical protein
MQPNNHPSFFRTNAIKHLHAMDATAPIFSVIQPASWMLLVSSLLVLISLLIWSLFGSIFLSSQAMGIILSKEGKAFALIDSHDANEINIGMEAYLLPMNMSAYRYGYIKGKVTDISDHPISKEKLYQYLGNFAWGNEYAKHGSPILINIHLYPSSVTASGFTWTSKKGPSFMIKPGTRVLVKIIKEKCRPLDLLLKRRLYS